MARGKYEQISRETAGQRISDRLHRSKVAQRFASALGAMSGLAIGLSAELDSEIVFGSGLLTGVASAGIGYLERRDAVKACNSTIRTRMMSRIDEIGTTGSAGYATVLNIDGESINVDEIPDYTSVPGLISYEGTPSGVAPAAWMLGTLFGEAALTAPSDTRATTAGLAVAMAGAGAFFTYLSEHGARDLERSYFRQLENIDQSPNSIG